MQRGTEKVVEFLNTWLITGNVLVRTQRWDELNVKMGPCLFKTCWYWNPLTKSVITSDFMRIGGVNPGDKSRNSETMEERPTLESCDRAFVALQTSYVVFFKYFCKKSLLSPTDGAAQTLYSSLESVKSNQMEIVFSNWIHETV